MSEYTFTTAIEAVEAFCHREFTGWPAEIETAVYHLVGRTQGVMPPHIAQLLAPFVLRVGADGPNMSLENCAACRGSGLQNGITGVEDCYACRGQGLVAKRDSKGRFAAAGGEAT